MRSSSTAAPRSAPESATMGPSDCMAPVRLRAGESGTPVSLDSSSITSFR
jgi:hypothetical protein